MTDTTGYAQDKYMHQRFEQKAEQRPDALAIAFEGEQVSYGDLNARSNRIAHALIRMGLKLNQPVAIMLDDGPRQVAGLFGVVKAGGVIVCLDPNYPSNRLSYIVEETTPPLLVAESSFTDRHPALLQQLRQSECKLLMLDLLMSDIGDLEAGKTGSDDRWVGAELLETCPTTNPDVKVKLEDPLYIVYTSGSTGRPKGIVQSHGSFHQFIEWQSSEFGIRAPQRFAQWASIAYDAGYRQIFGTLCFGATLCMAPSAIRYNPPALIQWVREARITILNVVPSFCWEIIEVLKSENPQDGHHPLPDLEKLLLAGEVLPVDLAHAWFDLFAQPPKLFNLYGPSECILATCYPVDKVRSDQRSVPIGRPIDGREILILDEAQHPCPIDVPGEIYIRSQYLTMGYFQRPEETSAKFIQNPSHNDYSDPVFRTGDIGRWSADKTIEYCGRMDNLVKLRGIRIELEDIESTLRRYDGIKSCAAVVRTVQRGRNTLVAKEREARKYTDSQQVLVAYFTAEERLSSADIQRFLEDNLPPHMIPQQFVRLDELPLNANRKLDRKALSELDIGRPEQKEPYAAPRNQNETLIAEIWQDVLGIDRAGVNDSFFGLGGDSLLAMQVINRIRQATNVRLSFRDLFENQTIARLTGLIQQPPEKRPPLSIVPAATSQPRTSYPLTLAQQGLWFLWRLEPDSPYYTGQGTISLRGKVQLPVLQRAWQALLERHAILRVRFSVENRKPIQIFEQRSNTDLRAVDLTDLPEVEQWRAIEQQAKKKAQHALDLEQAALFQAQLFKLAEDEYQVLLTFQEIILDLWGLSILVHDLGALYDGFVKGEKTPLPPLKLDFGDYALWENGHIQRHKLKAQEAYWQKQLAGELPILSLPTDRPRPVSPTYRGAGRSILLDADLSRQLKALSVQENATLFMTLLTAFNVLLHVYSGQDELLVGAPIANRTHEGAEDLVGFFLNMLPLRTQLGDDPTFLALLEQTRETVMGAISNADYPFMWMLEGTNVVRDMSVTPVFQVMFNMLNLPHSSPELSDLELAYNELETGYIKYDLALYAQEHGDQIFLQLAYLTDLFDEDTIDRMLNNLVVLLNSAVESPSSRISSLNVLTEIERRALLNDFNDTDRDFRNHLCIHQLFEQQVDKTPKQIAFIFQGQHLTYAELNARSNQLAHYLRRSGVGAGTVVAICHERSFEMLIGLLAIMKAGGTYVALDPDYPLLRLGDILEDTNPEILLVESDTDRFDAFTGKKICIDADRQLIEKEEATNPVCLTTPDDLLNTVYTSSTTGKPKGVLITMSSVLNRLFWMWEAYPFRSDDVAILQKSYALVAATWECFGALLKGIPTLILSREDLLDPAELWNRLVTHKVSYLLGSPALLEGVLQQAELHPAQWNAVRLATTSTEPVPPAMVKRWKNAFPQVPLLNLYGTTECASNVTVYDTTELPSNANRISIGQPLSNIQTYLLDDHLRPCPIGVTGELCVSGACLARGYLNNSALTEKQFAKHPFSDLGDSRLYRTGDLARYRADGNIELIGRKDQQVKIRGFRVELGDIETTLSRHETVRKCAVTLYQDETDRKRLVAYVVAEEHLSTSALRRFLQDRLPDYMVPTDYVMLDALPLTPNGKINRRALPTPDQARPDLDATYSPPSTPGEQLVADIWRQVLGVEQVGIHDDFFDLGGHSLLATQVISRLYDIFQVDMPLRKLFETPTVDGVVKALAQIFGEREVVEEIACALKEVGQLSEDDVKIRLAK